MCICVSGDKKANNPVYSGLLKGNTVKQMNKGAIGTLGMYIHILLYSSVIIQINCLGQMVGLFCHAV
jgi:hypothetical protein